jgi:hypothetical protein
VAGLRTDGSGWIRPVSQGEHGKLEYRDYQLPGGGQPDILDVLRVGVSKPEPKLHHPEDWLIDSTPWQLVSRPAPASLSHVVVGAIQKSDLIFGDDRPSIAARQVEEHGGVDSLALVRPENVQWRTATYGAWKKARVAFQLGRRTYDLPLTDPRYVGRVQRLETGDHQDHEVQIPNSVEYLFVISLTEPYQDGRCYKLVVGVVEIPFDWIV